MILVDTNVLLDLATNDATGAAWSQAQLEAAALRDDLAINAVVYAELSIGFRRIEEVDAIEAAQVAYRRAVVAQEKEDAARAAEPKPAAPKPKVKAPEPAASSEPPLSPLDLKALGEIRAMYQLLPPERLVAMCKRPPRGMERLFAILAREIGVEPGKPQGP